VIHTDGRWYLIGHCLSRQALRTFRLDRAVDLEVGAESFKRPASFDAKEYLSKGMPFIQSDHQIDVWIEMPIEEANRTFAPWRVITEEDNGGTRLRCGRDRLQMFAAMLLSMGRRIVVHEPPELRETISELAAQAMQAAQSPQRVR
jgi:predicted DNA-binding transcriptional regulator YafY